MAGIVLTDATGGEVTVADEDAAVRWEARGYTRASGGKKATSSKKKSDDK